MMDIKKTIKKLFSDSDEPTHPDFGDIFGEGDFIPNEDEFVGLEQQIRTPEPEPPKHELHWFITGMYEKISHDVDIFTGQYDKKRKIESTNQNLKEQFEQLAYGKK